MKFLIGIISGVALAGAGVGVVANNPFEAPAATVAPELALAQPVVAQTVAVAQTRVVARRLQGFTGELSHKDTGAFELKVSVRQNGELVERDVRVLVARAQVTNRAGQRVRLPLDEATARVTGSLLPRSAWRFDDDGKLLPTLAAKHVIVLTTSPPEQTDLETQSAQDSVEAQDPTD